MKPATLLILLILVIHAVPVKAQQLDRNIYIETVVNAPVTEVWKAWTTQQGLESFLAPESTIDLRVGGKLNIFFYPEAPVGQRGAEGLHILAVIPNKMFTFTWNNPPDIPEIRQQQTHVILKFFRSGSSGNQTRLILIHDGWGDGEFWDQAYRYFIRAWRDEVLFRLHYRFDVGPVNWSYPPQNTGKYNIILH